MNTKQPAFLGLNSKMNQHDFPDYPVEYLYWTDLNKTTPTKPALNNFATELRKNKHDFINCDHIDPYYILDETNKYTAQNMQRYKYNERGIKSKNHYYGGIIPMCLNYSIAVGLQAPYIARTAHTCDLLVVAVEKRENIVEPYNQEELKHKRIAGFVCINLIRKNIFEIDVIGARTNHMGVGGSLVKILCEHGKNVGLKYCWLNSVPNAVTFYLKLGFIYMGHTITSGIKKGYMLFELKNAEKGPHTKMIRQRGNSVNLSEIKEKGNPNMSAVEARNITDDNLDIIEDINLYIDTLSKSEEAQYKLKQFMVPITLTGSRKIDGYYIRQGFFEEICPSARRNPFYAAASAVPMLDPGVEAPSEVVNTKLESSSKKSRPNKTSARRNHLVPKPPPGPPPSYARKFNPTVPTPRQASKFFRTPIAWAIDITGINPANLSRRKGRNYHPTPRPHITRKNNH
jgi:hypothetical protein